MYKDLIVTALKLGHFSEDSEYTDQEQCRFKGHMPEQTEPTSLVILVKDHHHFLSGKSRMNQNISHVLNNFT